MVQINIDSLNFYDYKEYPFQVTFEIRKYNPSIKYMHVIKNNLDKMNIDHKLNFEPPGASIRIMFKHEKDFIFFKLKFKSQTFETIITFDD